MMFDSETLHNLTVVITAAKKHLSKDTIAKFFTMSKDMLAVIAYAITTGKNFYELSFDDKFQSLENKLEASYNAFIDAVEPVVEKFGL